MYFAFYDIPKQVMFYDDKEKTWLAGIAYKDEIICACCGNAIKIQEIENSAKNTQYKRVIYEYEDWVDLGESIYGGELPYGLEIEDGQLKEIF